MKRAACVMILLAVLAPAAVPTTVQAKKIYHPTRADEETYNPETKKWVDAGYIQERLNDSQQLKRVITVRKVPLGDDDEMSFRFITKFRYKKSSYIESTYLGGSLVEQLIYKLKDGHVIKTTCYDENQSVKWTTENTYKGDQLIRTIETDDKGRKKKEINRRYDSEGRLLRIRTAEYGPEGNKEFWYTTRYTYWKSGSRKKIVTRDNENGSRVITCYSNGLPKREKSHYPDVGDFDYSYTYKYYKKTTNVPREKTVKEYGEYTDRIRYSGFIKVPETFTGYIADPYEID